MESHPAARDKKLSICLIVRDEVKHLGRCLDSVAGIADEVVVVDTGSTDGTVAVARERSAEVFHYEWQDDFARARNYAKTKATGDWILQIDADEELFVEDRTGIRPLIATDDCDVALVAIHNRSSSVFGENVPSVHYLPRLFKNRGDIFYKYPIHENLTYTGRARTSDVRLLHHGYNGDADFLAEKRRRNAKVLQNSLAADPDNPSIHFYLSGHYLADEDFEQASMHAERAVTLLGACPGDNRHILLMALNNLCQIGLYRSQYDRVQAYYAQAHSVDSDYLGPRFFHGVSCFRQGNLEQAKAVFEDYLLRCAESGQRGSAEYYDHSSESYRFQVCHLLGKIYSREENRARAEQLFMQSVTLNPEFWIGFADLGYLAYRSGDLEKAAGFLEKAFSLAKDNPAVNKNHPELWQDFLNLSKSYLFLSKKMLSGK